MNNPTQVATLISGLMFGGGQRVALDLVEQSARSPDLGVRLLLLGCREESLKRHADAIIEYDGCYNSPRTLLDTAIRLRRYLQPSPPKILHTHGWDADIIGWLATRGTAISQICHLHVTPDWLYSPHFKHWVRRWLTRGALRNATRVVAVAEAVRMHWRDVLPQNSEGTVVIHNGVDVSRYRPAEPPRDISQLLVIGTAARLVPSKGFDCLLHALKLIANQGTRPCLRIAGDGPLKGNIEQLAKKLGLHDSVSLLGRVADMPQFYRSLDCFVLPSTEEEGLPLALLEAMATGLPVLTTRVGGAPEVVRDGEEGFLVEAGDPVALAAGFRRLLGESALRERFGQKARLRVLREFSVEHFSEQVFGLYHRLARTEVKSLHVG